MSTLAVPTDNEFADARVLLKPFVCTLIAAAKKRELSLWSAVSEFCADEDTSYPSPLPTGHDSGHRPMAPECLAKELASIATPLANMVVYVPAASAPSTATQTRATIRPAWLHQITAASAPEEIVALLRMFGLGTVADRLSYLLRLVEDDPDEPSIEIESLRALARFLMSERQLPDPQIGVAPDGFIQIEWRLPTNGILAMEFLPSGLIRFAAISAPAQRDVERLSVNGTLPKDATLRAVQPFSSQLKSQ